MTKAIDQFHVRENILIVLLIVFVQPLDAVVSHVLKTLRNGQLQTQKPLLCRNGMETTVH